MEKIYSNWFWGNLFNEVLFGVVIIGLLALFWCYIRDAYRVVRITRIISTHNNPTRTWRKGIYARDRFMKIYEAKDPIPSTQDLMYSPREHGGVWTERGVDEFILEYHGLITLKNAPNGLQAEVNKNRVSGWTYKLSKLIETREETRAKQFLTDTTGKFKKPPKK